jgi:hypothetical protein
VLRLTPEDLERMACELVTQKQVEERSTEEVCEAIVAKWPEVSEKLCQSFLEKAWDSIVERCPKAALQLTPEDIERMACELATQKQIEEQVTEEVCQLIEGSVSLFVWSRIRCLGLWGGACCRVFCASACPGVGSNCGSLICSGLACGRVFCANARPGVGSRG